MLNMDSPIPITRDLDLVVTSPSKKVFIGDHLPNGFQPADLASSLLKFCLRLLQLTILLVKSAFINRQLALQLLNLTAHFEKFVIFVCECTFALLELSTHSLKLKILLVKLQPIA